MSAIVYITGCSSGVAHSPSMLATLGIQRSPKHQPSFLSCFQQGQIVLDLCATHFRKLTSAFSTCLKLQPHSSRISLSDGLLYLFMPPFTHSTSPLIIALVSGDFFSPLFFCSHFFHPHSLTLCLPPPPAQSSLSVR